MSEHLVPVDGSELWETDEHVATSATVSTTLASVSAWSWSFNGVGDAPDGPDWLYANPQGDALEVGYQVSVHVFALKYVEYQLARGGDRQRVSGVDAFEQIPDEADEMMKAQEDQYDLHEWWVDITANGVDSEGGPATASGSLLVRIYANYDLSRDKLKEAVGARR